MRGRGAKTIGNIEAFGSLTPSCRGVAHDGVSDGVNRCQKSGILGKIRSDRVVDTHLSPSFFGKTKRPVAGSFASPNIVLDGSSLLPYLDDIKAKTFVKYYLIFI